MLLELAAALDFPEAVRWSALCSANGWPVPEQLDAAAMRLLNSTYGSALAREPLKKEYRRAVAARETRRCVVLLREIAAHEPESKNWVEDLERFETHRLSEIQTEHRQADGATDLITLESLFEELEARWTVDVKVMRATVAASLKRVRELDAATSGKRILADISTSYAAFEFDALGAALQQYELLMQAGYFHPDRELIMQHDEAQEWWSQEDARREKERAFTETLAQLTTELDRELPTAEIGRLWRALTAFDRPLPEDLSARATHAIEMYRLAQIRRIHRIVVLSATAASFAVAVVLLAVWRFQYTKAKQFWMGQLQNCIQALDLPRFTNTVTEIQNDRPLLFGRFLHRDPDLQNVIRKRIEFASEVHRRLAIMAESKRRFEALSEAKFPKDRGAEMQSLLDDAAKAAWQEMQRVEVRQWNAAWEEARTLEVAAQDSELRKVMMDMATLSLDINLTEAELEDLLQKDKQLDGLIEEGRRTAEGTSPGMRDEFHKQQEMAESLKRAIQERSRALSAVRGATDVTTYLVALSAYVDQFPQDKRSEAVRGALAKASDYKFLAVLPAIPTTNTAVLLTRLSARAADIGQDNYFWSALVVWYLEQESRVKTKWPQIQETIRSLRDDKTLADLYTFEKDTPEPVRFFLQGGEHRGESSLFGNMYSPKPSDKKARFVNRGERNTDIKNLRKMAHCAAVLELIKGADVPAGEGDGFLIRSMAGVCADTRYPTPYLKVKLVKFLSSQLVELVGPGTIPAVELALEALNKADDEEFDWLCVFHPDMTNKYAASAQVLATHFQKASFPAEYRFMREMNLRTLIRGAKWVGFADPKAQLVFPSGVRPVEIWGLRGEPGGRQHTEVLAELTPQGGYRLVSPLQPGEPLLAPGDDKSSLAVLQEVVIKTGFPEVGLTAFAWPAPWPANRRSLTPGRESATASPAPFPSNVAPAGSDVARNSFSD